MKKMSVAWLALGLLVHACAAPAFAEGMAVTAYVGESTEVCQPATSAAVLCSNDVSGYSAAAVQFGSVGSGNVVTLEASNDAVNWVVVTNQFSTSVALVGGGVISPATTEQYIVRLTSKYFRVRVSTYSSGTVTAIVTYKSADPGPNVMGAVGTVASGSADSGNPVKVGGRYNSTKPTFTDGQRGDLQLDTRGSLLTALCEQNATRCAGVPSTLGDGNAYQGALSVSSQNFQISTNTAWDREFTCANSAVINVAAAATTQLVALGSSQVIRVCSFVITGDTAATTATFVYGTGSNCATGQVSLTGAMRMVDEGNISSTGMNGSLFRTAASNALCLTAATGAVTGFVTYAQY